MIARPVDKAVKNTSPGRGRDLFVRASWLRPMKAAMTVPAKPITATTISFGIVTSCLPLQPGQSLLVVSRRTSDSTACPSATNVHTTQRERPMHSPLPFWPQPISLCTGALAKCIPFSDPCQHGRLGRRSTWIARGRLPVATVRPSRRSGRDLFPQDSSKVRRISFLGFPPLLLTTAVRPCFGIVLLRRPIDGRVWIHGLALSTWSDWASPLKTVASAVRSAA